MKGVLLLMGKAVDSLTTDGSAQDPLDGNQQIEGGERR